MKRAVKLPREWEARREALEREEREEDVDRNAWKREEWRDGEDVGAPCDPPPPAPESWDKGCVILVARAAGLVGALHSKASASRRRMLLLHAQRH